MHQRHISGFLKTTPSYIDACIYYSPKEVADYWKRVSEDDQLFRYHTTNFDFKLARETWKRVCVRADVCVTCKLAHKMKTQGIETQNRKRIRNYSTASIFVKGSSELNNYSCNILGQILTVM